MKSYKEMADNALKRIKEHNQKKKKNGYVIMSVISVFLLVIAYQMSQFGKSNLDDKPIKEDIQIITEYYTDKNYSYIPPKNGQFYCLIDVLEARRHYINQNVKFLLIVDLFSEDNDIYKEIKKSEIIEEYRRLFDDGYNVYILDDEFSTSIIGIFTEEELEDFRSNKNYGYTFRFVPRDSEFVDEIEAITDFDNIFEV